MSVIKILVMDVDGTLTDGKIYISEHGELFKAFNVKDGYGIHDLLPSMDIIPVIITSRSSDILVLRCKELGITELYQGIRNKSGCLNEIVDRYGIAMCNVAYIGDDIPDMKVMSMVKEGGGLVGCPADADEEVAGISDHISSKRGGDGAVREFIEWINKQR